MEPGCLDWSSVLAVGQQIIAFCSCYEWIWHTAVERATLSFHTPANPSYKRLDSSLTGFIWGGQVFYKSLACTLPRALCALCLVHWPFSSTCLSDKSRCFFILETLSRCSCSCAGNRELLWLHPIDKKRITRLTESSLFPEELVSRLGQSPFCSVDVVPRVTEQQLKRLKKESIRLNFWWAVQQNRHNFFNVLEKPKPWWQTRAVDVETWLTELTFSVSF